MNFIDKIQAYFNITSFKIVIESEIPIFNKIIVYRSTYRNNSLYENNNKYDIITLTKEKRTRHSAAIFNKFSHILRLVK